MAFLSFLISSATSGMFPGSLGLFLNSVALAFIFHEGLGLTDVMGLLTFCSLLAAWGGGCSVSRGCCSRLGLQRLACSKVGVVRKVCYRGA